MKDDLDAPLWRSVVGDPEPWRRGRWVLVIVAVLTALLQFWTISVLALGGFVEILIVQTAAIALYWLAFYLIWIGVQWVRWVHGGVSIVYGFTMLVWGFRDWGGLIPVGLYAMFVGAYVGFSPAVYFFAQRQRERRDWRYTLAIGVGFGLLLASLGCGMVGLLAYKTQQEEEARAFADTTFQRLFTQHDTEFLLTHATPRLLAPPLGRLYLTNFLTGATMQAGDVHNIQKSRGTVTLRLAYPATFYVQGRMVTEGEGEKGRVVLRLGLGGVPGDWQLDEASWFYPAPNTR